MSLERCEQDIYDNGTTVFLTNSIGQDDMEAWVQEIAKESEQKVDWRYGCGRAEVIALGDLNRVRKAILKTGHMHDASYTKAVSEYFDSEDDKKIMDRQIKGIWNYNAVNYNLYKKE